MINISLIFLELLSCYITMYLLNRHFKLDGMYIYGIISSAVSTIMIHKTIAVASIGIPLGFATTTSIIIGGIIITQKYGKENLNKYLIMILITMILCMTFFNIAGLIANSNYGIATNNAFNNIFKYQIRVYIVLLLTLIFSIWVGSNIYYHIKRIYHNIVISNFIAIIITMLIDNILFSISNYLFEYDLISITLCIFFRYMLMLPIGIIGTIPLHLIDKIDK